VRRAALVLVAAGVLAMGSAAATGGAAPPASALIGAPPSSLVAGQPWLVRVDSRSRVTEIRARSHGRVLTMAARRAAANIYAAELTLPAPGVWQLVARVGRSERALARVHALPTYRLALPAQVLAQDNETLLVVERRGAGRVLSVDLSDGRISVFSRAVQDPWGLAAADGGGVLVSGSSGVYSLDRRGRARLISRVSASPIAALDGEVVYANEREVGRIRDGTTTVLTRDVDAPHGLFLSVTGDVIVSDTGHGRLIRVARGGGAVTLVASSLEQPLGAIDDGAGGALVVEFASGRLLRVRPDGSRSVAARSLRKPYALTRTPGGTIYVVESGELDHPSGGLAGVADGVVDRLRLVPTWRAS
jgi:hypothetical protein